MRPGTEGGGVWGSGDAYDEGVCKEGGGVGDEGGDGKGVGVRVRRLNSVEFTGADTLDMNDDMAGGMISNPRDFGSWMGYA